MNEEDDQDDETLVPEDFPWDPFPASLAGAQMKVAAREIDGKYVVGLTEDERRGRYMVCLDLVPEGHPNSPSDGHLKLPHLS